MTHGVNRTVHSWRAGAILLALVAGAALIYRILPASAGRADMKPADQRAELAPFAAQDLSGNTFRLADHRGKVVLVNYFATWCPPCRAEMPGIVNLARDYKAKGLETVAISVDEGGVDKVKRFVQAYEIGFPVVMASQDPKLAAGIRSIPVTLLLDRQGRIAARHVGAVQESTLKAEVEKLLAEK